MKGSQCLLLLALASIHAAPSETFIEEELTYAPWFTGPLLAPTPINMDPKHPAIEPSVTFFDFYGIYTANWRTQVQDAIWAINPLIDFQFGITDSLGIETLVSFISNFQKGQTFSDFQDTIVLFGYQLANDIKGSWVPDIRIDLQETFPTGHYQRLSPGKQRLEATGFGSFQTGPVLVMRKLFHIASHSLSLLWSVNYLFPSSVHVSGFNTYGGGYGTKGKVTPGQNLTAYFSGEYSINQRWVLAFDTEFFYQKKSRFHGKNGTTTTGEIASTGLPSSVQLSFAPEIEYNLSPSSGLLMGIWGSIAGKNAPAFAAAFCAYLHVF